MRWQTVVDAEHGATAKCRRQTYKDEQRERSAGRGPRLVVEARELGTYDELFNVDFSTVKGQVA